MSSAILQGVPGSTQDIDLWLDLAPRQYMRAINLACSLGAQMVRNTVVELLDGTLVNFSYEVTGLGKFASEFRHAKLLPFHGQRVPVMPLELIRKSKEAIRRPKDFRSLGDHRPNAPAQTCREEINTMHSFRIPHSALGSWLPDMDLNHDKQIQSLLCYRYTIGQSGAEGKLNGFPSQSSRQALARSFSKRGDAAWKRIGFLRQVFV